MKCAHLFAALVSAPATPMLVRALNFSGDKPTLMFLTTLLLLVTASVFFMSFIFVIFGDTSKATDGYKRTRPDYLQFDPITCALLSGSTFSAMGLVSLMYSLADVIGHWEWAFLVCIGLGSYFGAWLSIFFLRR